VNAPVPLIVTFCGVDSDVQNGVPEYEIVAVGRRVTVMVVVVVFEHRPSLKE
jgi:hypothetical protein